MILNPRLPLLIAVVVGLWAGWTSTPAETPTVSPAGFVEEYIRELGELQDAREQFDLDFSAASSDVAKLYTDVRGASRDILILGVNQRQIQGAVAPQLTKARDLLAATYAWQEQIFTELRENAEAVLAGPKEGVDYSSLAAHSPELTARMEMLNKNLLGLTTVICLSLVDQRADSHGHLSHILLTSTERKQLLEELHAQFGPQNHRTTSYYSQSAELIDAFLSSARKSSDQRW